MVLSGDQSTRVTIKTMHQNYLEPPYGLVWIVYSSLPYSPIIYFSKCTKPNRSKYHKALSFGEHQDSSNNDTEWLRPYRKLRLIEENSIKWCSFKCRQEFIRDVSWFQLNMTSLACIFINTKDDKQQKLLYSNFRNTSHLGLPTLGQHNFFELGH